MIFFRGLEGICFEGGVFFFRLIFFLDYLLSLFKMKFICDLFYLNSR